MIKKIEKLIANDFSRPRINNLSLEELEIEYNIFFQKKLIEITNAVNILKNKRYDA